MPRRKRRKEHLSEEQIRERVNRVMDHWQSYPDFAHLFDALLCANDNIHGKEFAGLYTERTGRTLERAFIQRYRTGETAPTYPFVSDLLQHDLLNLEPELICPATADRPAEPYRVALFSKAGLIEVTPESVREWNRDVLASHRLRLESSPHGRSPSWGDIMHKLVSFHTQGERMSLREVGAAVSALPNSTTLRRVDRLEQLLINRGHPSEQERQALYHFIGLDEAEARYIEEGIESGRIPIGDRALAQTSHFSRELTDILDKLAPHGISQVQLARRSANPATGEPDFTQTTLSSWKRGTTTPSLYCLRALARALRQCCNEKGQRLVTEEEVNQVIQASGWTAADLSDTSHDIIARINGAMTIKPLLSAIRNAADISVPLSAVAAMDQGPPPRPVRLPTWGTMNRWENEGYDQPTPGQVRELLERYSIILTRNGHQPLGPEEIERVVAVAERDYARWEQQPFAVKNARRVNYARNRGAPSPTFDDGPGR